MSIRRRAAFLPSCVALCLAAHSICSAAAGTFANTNRVIVNDPFPPGVAKATPYPSTITVSGFNASETIQKVTITLHAVSHGTPDDLDILLVSPGGQNVIIFSDAGGGFADPELPLTITIDDAAPAMVPDHGPLLSGTFRASNFEAGDSFPTNAPTPSGATNLAVFAGGAPNGDWRLYVVDDEALDAGSISNGWSLTIQTSGAGPGPSLSTLRSNSFLIVSWPVSPVNYQLQETTNLVAVSSWSTVAQPAVTNGNQVRVTVPTSAVRKFFRLRSP